MISVQGQDVDSFLKKTREMVKPAAKGLLLCHAGKRFEEAMLYQFNTGGKCLRPALVLLSCAACGGREKDALYAAASVELLHNYSLIIDDIIDHSDLRRGELTTWKKWGSSIAQCTGVHYVAAVFQGALRSPEPIRISAILSDALQILLEGEMLDIFQERAGRQDEPLVLEQRYGVVEKKDYLEMADKKTAKLFEASCLVGGTCAGASPGELKALKDYGFNLGMAFQARDDILDIFGQDDFGKKIGKDIEERKGGNIVILFALEEKGNEELNNILYKDNLTEADIKRAIEIISQTGALGRAMELCREYADKAKDFLNRLPAGPERAMMESIVEYVLDRAK